MKIKRVLLAEAQHRRLHSAFGWVRAHIGADISLLKSRTLWIYDIHVYRKCVSKKKRKQEKKQQQKQEKRGPAECLQ